MHVHCTLGGPGGWVHTFFWAPIDVGYLRDRWESMIFVLGFVLACLMIASSEETWEGCALQSLGPRWVSVFHPGGGLARSGIPPIRGQGTRKSVAVECGLSP